IADLPGQVVLAATRAGANAQRPHACLEYRCRAGKSRDGCVRSSLLYGSATRDSRTPLRSLLVNPRNRNNTALKANLSVLEETSERDSSSARSSDATIRDRPPNSSPR